MDNAKIKVPAPEGVVSSRFFATGWGRQQGWQKRGRHDGAALDVPFWPPSSKTPRPNPDLQVHNVLYERCAALYGVPYCTKAVPYCTSVVPWCTSAVLHCTKAVLQCTNAVLCTM